MTPWQLVSKSEHSHQRAVFAWANCAALYGFDVADDPRGYVLAERTQWLSEMRSLDLQPRPELARLFAIHNQGHGDAIRGAQAKAEGVKRGVGDMMLPVPRMKEKPFDRAFHDMMYHGLFIELKRPKLVGTVKGTESPEQAEWRDYLNSVGYRSVVCVGWLEAVAAIKDYLK